MATLSDRAQALIDAARGERNANAAPSVLMPKLPSAVAAPYSHQAMIELMIGCPQYTHKQLAEHFGRGLSWFASVLASDMFQQALDPHRHLIGDPYITATMEERMRALALRSSSVLMTKLDAPGVNDMVVLKAAEIGIKALGLGNPKLVEPPPTAPAERSIEDVANRLLAAMDRRDQLRTIEGTATALPVGDDDD